MVSFSNSRIKGDSTDSSTAHFSIFLFCCIGPHLAPAIQGSFLVTQASCTATARKLLGKKQTSASTLWCSDHSMLCPFIAWNNLFTNLHHSASLETNNHPVTTSNSKIHYRLKGHTETQSLMKWILRWLIRGSPALPHNPHTAWTAAGLNIPLCESL